jgi:hypothetical protein
MSFALAAWSAYIGSGIVSACGDWRLWVMRSNPASEKVKRHFLKKTI